MIASSMPPQLLVGEVNENESQESDNYNEIVYYKTYPKNDFKDFIKKRITANEKENKLLS